MGSRRVWSVLLVLFALEVDASAQEELYGARGGEYLFGFSANYRYARARELASDANETEVFTGRGTLSIFLQREHEIGLELAPSLVRNELGGDSTDVYGGAFYSYNWWTSPQTTLYAGPQVGLLYVDPSGVGSDTAFSWGAHAGVRYWIDPRISLGIEPRLSFTHLDRELGGDQTLLDVFFGLSVKL